jgi:hypothetical protein
MSRVDELPPDQRAALSVLLRQRKSYAEVAAMLAIAEQAVQDRAHAALTVLAPREARELDAASRRLIGDYLLGQQPAVADRLRARTLLASSAAANAWARAIAGELGAAGLEHDAEIPDAGPGAATTPEAQTPAPAGEAGSESGSQVPYPLAEAAAHASDASSEQGSPSSRRGGALLLAAIVAAVVVVVVLVSGGGGKAHPKDTSAAAAGAAGGAKAQARFALKSPDGSSRSVGAVEVLSEGGKRAFYIQAEHIPATSHFFYAIWLYNSPSSALPLSKSPPVGSSHKLAGAALLPSNAGQFHEILLTQETSTRPTHPGHVVLRGPFSLTG